MISTLAAHHQKRERLLFRDTFTDTDNVLLANHVPDYSASPASSMWTVNNNINHPGVGDTRIIGNRARNLSTQSGGNTFFSIDTGVSKYRVKYKIVPTDSFIVGHLAGGLDAIDFVVLGATSTALIRKIIDFTTSPAYTTLDTYSLSVGAGDWVELDAYIDGTSVQCKLTKISTGENETLSVNPTGLRLSGTIGFTLDNYSANYAEVDDFEVWEY